MVQSFRPVPSNLASGLVNIAPNIWTIEAKTCVCYRPPMQPRYPYTHRAIVIRLNDNNLNNSLFILSPIPLTPEIRADIDRLGVVRFIVSPNHLHHLSMGDWSQAYPDAKLYASPGLAAKRQDLTFYKTLSTNTAEPEWQDQIDQCVFGSGKGWFDELVFCHRASRTVIFTDFIMDFDPSVFSPIARVTTRWNQMYRHTPRGIQLAHPFDRAILREALKTVRDWEPDCAIVAHSPWLCVERKPQVDEFLDSAFDWLTPQPVVIETILSIVRFLTLLLVILPIHAVIVLIADRILPRFTVRESD